MLLFCGSFGRHNDLEFVVNDFSDSLADGLFAFSFENVIALAVLDRICFAKKLGFLAFTVFLIDKLACTLCGGNDYGISVDVFLGCQFLYCRMKKHFVFLLIYLENQYILSISYLFCAKNMSAILSFMRLQRSAATTDRTVPAASAALPSLLITR